jgi:hypothetical protein
MGLGYQNYDITVVDGRTREPITTGVYVFVYGAGTKTLSTIYSTENGTAKTNPVTRTQFATDAKISFWSAATSHDVFIADEKGNVAFIPGLTPNDHTVRLNREGVDKVLIAPFLFNSGGTEVDTGLDFPLNVLVKDVMIEVVTLDATETLHVGILSSETNGDADGFLVAVDLATAGFIRPWVITDSTTEDFITTPYYGALMGKGSAGTSAANDFGQSGGFGHIVSGSNGRSLSYTPSTSDTAAGYIYAYFKHIR